MNIHGHSHPKLNEALAAQARELEHVVFANCTHRPAVELAERLLAVLPPGLTRVFYSDNGSTAVEVALKMARQYWTNRGEPKRTTFVTLHHAYHGDTVGAMSTSDDSIFTRPFAPMLFDVSRAHAPYCYRCPLGLERATCQVECLGATPAPAPATLGALLEQLGGSVAAVLVEPMLQGAGGMIVWPPEFLAGVRRLCDRFGTLMIADEVLTGFGRTGTDVRLRARLGGARHHLSVKGADRRLSAAGGNRLDRSRLRHVPERRSHEDLFSRSLVHRQPARLRGRGREPRPVPGNRCARAGRGTRALTAKRVSSRCADLPIVGDVRILGGVGIVELVADKEAGTAGGYLDQIGPRLTEAFLERGLLLRPLGNVLYVMPPYVITEAETAWVLEQISDVLQDESLSAGR